jgi:hypothetical protein
MSHFGAAIAEGPLFDEEIEKWDSRLFTESRGQML